MTARFARPIACALALVLAVAALSGCSPAGKSPSGKDTATRSEDLTAGEFPERTPTSPQAPPPPMLRSPKSAVYSYLVWISYAYRVLDSNVATMAFSEYEEVRVNSYVELNRQEGRAIDQRLLSFDVKQVRTKGDTATVSAAEAWRYRYIDIKSGDYASPAYDVSYDTTYTVVKVKGKGWLVDRVAVAPRGGQPK